MQAVIQDWPGPPAKATNLTIEHSKQEINVLLAPKLPLDVHSGSASLL
jgi:hypothetical protein